MLLRGRFFQGLRESSFTWCTCRILHIREQFDNENVWTSHFRINKYLRQMLCTRRLEIFSECATSLTEKENRRVTKPRVEGARPHAYRKSHEQKLAAVLETWSNNYARSVWLNGLQNTDHQKKTCTESKSHRARWKDDTWQSTHVLLL